MSATAAPSGGGPCYLGVDVGTSMTKAAVFDEGGDLVASADRPTRLAFGGEGRVEQSVEDVLHSVATVITDVLAGCGGREPERIAITGQGDGCWLVDEHGRGVRPAVSWMDGRSTPQLTHWDSNGAVEKVYRINGNALFPGAMAPILAWLDEHEPTALDRAATAHYCKDVILGRLTGLRATDPSDASLPFGTPDGQGYSSQVLQVLDLEHRADLLPPAQHPLPSAAMTAAGAALTGLREGMPVSAGPFDLPACAAGAGVDQVGDGLLIVGTTLACQVRVDHLDLAANPAGMHLATATPGQWLRALPAMVGTASLDWVLDLLGLRHDRVGGAIEASSPGAGGVEVLPYLAPSGERAPFVDPTARGQLTGLSLTTSNDDVVRAVCEGIAFAARDCFEVTELTGTLYVCGGGARSRPWLQIFADVLGRPLHVAQTLGVGARGAVLSALAGSAQSPDLAVWTAAESVVEPRTELAGQYDELFDRYRAHRSAARQLWRTTP